MIFCLVLCVSGDSSTFVLIVINDNADYYTHVKEYNMATSVESVVNELISAVFTAHSFLETG